MHGLQTHNETLAQIVICVIRISKIEEVNSTMVACCLTTFYSINSKFKYVLLENLKRGIRGLTSSPYYGNASYVPAARPWIRPNEEVRLCS